MTHVVAHVIAHVLHMLDTGPLVSSPVAPWSIYACDTCLDPYFTYMSMSGGAKAGMWGVALYVVRGGVVRGGVVRGGVVTGGVVSSL